jgi:Amt family ammonium transporter
METLPTIDIVKLCPDRKRPAQFSAAKKVVPSAFMLISFILIFLLTIAGAAYAAIDVQKDTVKHDSAAAPLVVVQTTAAVAVPVPPAPTPNKGDVAWMLVCTALVLLMSVPALALFYGGLVRTKNILSMLMQVFVTFSLITVLWCIYGYSLAFTEGNAFFGGFS